MFLKKHDIECQLLFLRFPIAAGFLPSANPDLGIGGSFSFSVQPT